MNTDLDQVVLVTTEDQPIGVMDKLEAHEKGVLHRAFSVFVFNDQGQLLLQQRAMEKYHSPGLWTNTCCSHQRSGETTEEAAHRRLVEEMGFDCTLTKAFEFVYRAEFDNGLTEHEYDHVLIGTYNDSPEPDPAEVGGWQYVDTDDLVKKINAQPEQYTEWFKIALPQLLSHMQDLNQ